MIMSFPNAKAIILSSSEDIQETEGDAREDGTIIVESQILYCANPLISG
jgi:hypothetical protein